LEEDRDRIAVLNIEKRGLELLNLSGGSLTAPTAPQMTDVFPNRCGDPSPFRAGRRSDFRLSKLANYLFVNSLI
jgi:transposase